VLILPADFYDNGLVSVVPADMILCMSGY
jgi:hypothetical protein